METLKKVDSLYGTSSAAKCNSEYLRELINTNLKYMGVTLKNTIGGELICVG